MCVLGCKFAGIARAFKHKAAVVEEYFAAVFEANASQVVEWNFCGQGFDAAIFQIELGTGIEKVPAFYFANFTHDCVAGRCADFFLGGQGPGEKKS